MNRELLERPFTAGADPPAQGAQRPARLRGGPQRDPASERGAGGRVVVRDRASRDPRGGGGGDRPAHGRGRREDGVRRQPGDARAGVGRAHLDQRRPEERGDRRAQEVRDVSRRGVAPLRREADRRSGAGGARSRRAAPAGGGAEPAGEDAAERHAAEQGASPATASRATATRTAASRRASSTRSGRWGGRRGSTRTRWGT